jgi:hypothetical protein
MTVRSSLDQRKALDQSSFTSVSPAGVPLGSQEPGDPDRDTS